MSELTMTKREIIRNFILSNNHLPKQGTDEWRNARKWFIGGSEIAVLLNKNKNKTIRKLVLEKVGHHTFTGNSATYWGNIFEPLIRNYSNNHFNCSIVETGSIPYKDSNLSYSPDGIAHVKKEKIQPIIDNDKLSELSDEEHIVLFEFKCPHSRIPNGEVPEYYVPQPLLGMNIIDMCEVSMFIEAIFRRCAFYDLKYNNNHVAFGHYNRTKLSNTPLEYGFMTIYTDTSNMSETAQEIIDKIYHSNTKKIKKVYDLSTLYDKELFDNVLSACISGDFQIEYSFNEQYNQDIFQSYKYIVDNYNKACQYRAINRLEEIKEEKKEQLIGVLPYKLMEVHITPIYKDHSFIESNNLVYKSKTIMEFIKEHGDKDEKEITKLLKKIAL